METSGGNGRLPGGAQRLPEERAFEPSQEALMAVGGKAKGGRGGGCRGQARQVKLDKGDPIPDLPPPGEDLLPLQLASEPPNLPAGCPAPVSEAAGSGPGPAEPPAGVGEAVSPLPSL